MLTPEVLCHWAGGRLRFLVLGTAFCCCTGIALGLAEPVNSVGGAMSKVLMVSVPATWISILLFLTLAFWAALGLVLEYRLPFLIVQAVAPTGGMFTFLSLWTGAICSKGMTGLWWFGDARQVAGLVLLFLYLAVIAIPVLVSGGRRADRITAVLAVFGVAYVTLLFFAVQWWQVYQPSGELSPVPVSLTWPMVVSVVFVLVGFWLYATLAALLRLRQIVLERDLIPWSTA